MIINLDINLVDWYARVAKNPRLSLSHHHPATKLIQVLGKDLRFNRHMATHSTTGCVASAIWVGVRADGDATSEWIRDATCN